MDNVYFMDTPSKSATKQSCSKTASAKEIAKYKKILQQVLYDPDSELSRVTTLDILNIVCEKSIHQLAEEIYYVIDGVNGCKIPAIETLALGLQIPWFEDMAYEIFIIESDPDVQFAALLSWTSYYIGSKNAAVLDVLYKLIVSNHVDLKINKLAVSLLFDVSGW